MIRHNASPRGRWDRPWRPAGHAITIAHEGGHALAAILAGGLVSYLWVRRDRTGETRATALSRLTVVPFVLAGYLASSLFGLAGAAVLVLGRPAAVLWARVALLVLALTVASPWFTRAAVVAVGAVLGLALRAQSDDVTLIKRAHRMRVSVRLDRSAARCEPTSPFDNPREDLPRSD